MIEFLYADLRTIERLSVTTPFICLNGITIHHIDELQFHETDEEYVVMRLISQDKEIGNAAIQQNEKVIVDEANQYIIVPAEELAF